MHMIEHPERVEALLSGHAALLPVQPPEVNAFILQLVMQVEVCLHESWTGHIEFHRFPASWIYAHVQGGPLITVLESANAIARVYIKRGLETVLMQ